MKVSDFTVDFRSGIPAYIQIVEQVQHKLSQGLLKPGEQLPTVRQMAAHLRVNFNTIARAYRVLDDAGLISTQQGRGTYILERLEENVINSSSAARCWRRRGFFLNHLCGRDTNPRKWRNACEIFYTTGKTPRVYLLRKFVCEKWNEKNSAKQPRKFAKEVNRVLPFCTSGGWG